MNWYMNTSETGCRNKPHVAPTPDVQNVNTLTVRSSLFLSSVKDVSAVLATTNQYDSECVTDVSVTKRFGWNPFE
jgi:hypothetical protein